MKTEEVLVLALAGVAALLIVRSVKVGAGATESPGAKPAGWVSEIFDGDGSSFSNGWRYFNDGTAIDPSGCYYSGGALVWCPK